MSDEKGKTDEDWKVEAVRGAKEIYEDTLQPAAKEVGKALETTMKTVNVAFAPLRLLIHLSDKFENEVLPSIARKIRNIPKERLIEPNLHVAGPALEALRFVMDEPDLR